jgi:hypothetical protein
MFCVARKGKPTPQVWAVSSRQLATAESVMVGVEGEFIKTSTVAMHKKNSNIFIYNNELI